MAAKFTRDPQGGYNIEFRGQYVGSYKNGNFTSHFMGDVIRTFIPDYYSFRGIQNEIGRILNLQERTGTLDENSYYLLADDLYDF